MKLPVLEVLCYALQVFVVLAKERYQLISVTPKNETELKLLQLLESKFDELDFWQTATGAGLRADFMAPSKLSAVILRYFNEHDFDYELIIPDIENELLRVAAESASNERVLSDSPLSSVPSFDFAKYHPLDEIESFLQNAANNFPHVSDLTTLGTTHEGRQIKTLRIGIPSSIGSEKPMFWFDGGIHAREWASPHTVAYFVHTLLMGYENRDPTIMGYLEQLDFILTPVLNPDGYAFSWSSTNPLIRFWRKSRAPQGCLTDRSHRACCNGVDLNRNFDISWAGPGRTSGNKCKDTFHGAQAFSEAESQAVRDFVLRYADRLRAFISVHMYAQMWMHPFGYKKKTYPEDNDELVRVANAGAAAIQATFGTEYKVGTGADLWYATPGNSVDWVKKQGVKYCYLLELRPNRRTRWQQGFMLPADQLLATAKETWQGVRAVIDAIVPPSP